MCLHFNWLKQLVMGTSIAALLNVVSMAMMEFGCIEAGQDSSDVSWAETKTAATMLIHTILNMAAPMSSHHQQ